jgi:S1-C subfamily serine protease
MYRTALASSLLLLPAALLSAADKPAAEEPLAALQNSVAGVIDRAAPSVVCVLVSRSDGYKQLGALPPTDSPGRLAGFDADRLREEAKKRFDRTREALVNRLDLAGPNHVPESFGSGIVIDESGLVLTNYHVVRDATKVYVRLPGAKGSYADIHAADPRSDLAVLKLLAPPRGLKATELGRGEDVRRGQFVLALTNTFAAGFRDDGPGAELGMVSAVRHKVEGKAPQDPADADDRFKALSNYPTLIQTTARLNAACSGGALLNLKGELVGMTSSLAATVNSDAPGGFAVPTDEAVRRIVKVLKEGKEVEYGFIGINFPPQAGSDGVRIIAVMPGSPAAKAGVPANHYLVKANGVPIKTNDDVVLAIGTALAGSTIQVDVAATPDGRTSRYEIQLAKYYVPGAFIASVRPPAVGGLRVDYTSTLIQAPGGNQRIPDGVVVREVLPGSPAEKANVQVGRVVTKVNGRGVFSPAEYYEEVRKGTGPLELTFSSGEAVKVERR